MLMNLLFFVYFRIYILSDTVLVYLEFLCIFFKYLIGFCFFNYFIKILFQYLNNTDTVTTILAVLISSVKLVRMLMIYSWNCKILVVMGTLTI